MKKSIQTAKFLVAFACFPFLSKAQMVTNNLPIFISAGLDVQVNASVHIQAGSMVVNDGNLNIANDFTIAGMIKGNGTTDYGGNMTNTGIFSPGNNLGIFNSNNYDNGSSGTLNIEIGGIHAGTDYDVMAMSDNVTLDGTLNINFVNGFTPAVGNTFNILTYNARTGTFPTVNYPAMSGLNFSISYTTNAVVLTAQSAILNAELISFQGFSNGKTNILKWLTADEMDHKGFEIERKDGDGNWAKLGFISAHGAGKEYQFEDFKPHFISYYRLRQISNDGEIVYSKIITIEQNNKRELLVYPNPTSGKIKIETSLEQVESVKIINNLGQTVLNSKVFNNEMDISHLNKGIYYLQIVMNNAVWVKQIVKE